MGTPNQVYEAARQIVEHTADLHGALSLAGRFDLVTSINKIQKKAACILKLERPLRDPVAGAREDLMNAVGYLYHLLKAHVGTEEEMIMDEIVAMTRTADVLARRGYAYLDMVTLAEEEKMNQWMENGGNDAA